MIFIPGNADATRRSHEFQSSMVGLYSDTWSRKQGQLGQIINDGQQNIISDRKPVSSWDDVVKNWKQTGGDKVRTEFEEALQRENG